MYMNVLEQLVRSKCAVFLACVTRFLNCTKQCELVKVKHGNTLVYCVIGIAGPATVVAYQNCRLKQQLLGV